MHVEEINIGPSEAIAPVQAASALVGKGLQGDRHLYQEGAAPGQALTLIEAEVLEGVGLTGAESRRQVMVRGVRLNDLVGRRFRVGEVECLGVELCEPWPAPAAADAAGDHQGTDPPGRAQRRAWAEDVRRRPLALR